MTDDNSNNDWLEVVRRKAATASKQPPAGSWEALSARMAAAKPQQQAVAPATAPRRRGGLRWLWVASAAAVVAIVAAVCVRLLSSPGVSTLPASVPVPGMAAAASPKPQSEALLVQARAEGRRMARRHRLRHAVVADSAEWPADSVNMGALYASSEGGPGRPNRPMGQADGEEAPSSSLNPWQNYSDHEYDAYRQMEENARRLSDSGTLPGQLQRQGGRLWSIDVNVAGLSVAPRHTEASGVAYSHNMPLRVGVGVGRDLLAGRLTVSAGVAYTLLRTEADGAKCRMHLLSVPVGARWNAYRRGRLKLYAGAEAAAMLPLEAKRGGESADKGKVEWSASALGGVQCQLSGAVGVYAEPRLVWNISGTPMPTVRTAADVDFDLQLGVRIGF